MYLTIQGIVLRVTDYNDRDALLEAARTLPLQ